jgi:hypothetical protein
MMNLVSFILLGGIHHTWDLYGVIDKVEFLKRKGREVGTLKSLVNN